MTILSQLIEKYNIGDRRYHFCLRCFSYCTEYFLQGRFYFMVERRTLFTMTFEI